MKTNCFFLKSLFLAVGTLVAMTFVSCSSDDDNYSYTPGPAPSEELATQEGGSVSRRASSAPKSMFEAKLEDIGKVIGSDGMIYDKVSDIVSPVKPEAMLAYVTPSFISKTGIKVYVKATGLAIALQNASERACNRSQADELTSAWNKNHVIEGGTWRIPTEKDYKNMFAFCGGKPYNEKKYNDPYYTGVWSSGNFRNMLKALGNYDVWNCEYWTGSERSERSKMIYDFAEDEREFYYLYPDQYACLRTVLAF